MKPLYYNEPRVNAMKEFIYVHKTTKERHAFTRTLLHTFVREQDGKVFSCQFIGRLYEEVPKNEVKVEGDIDKPRKCLRCKQMRQPSNFYLSAKGQNNICRICIKEAAQKKRAGIKVKTKREKMDEINEKARAKYAEKKLALEIQRCNLRGPKK